EREADFDAAYSADSGQDDSGEDDSGDANSGDANSGDANSGEDDSGEDDSGEDEVEFLDAHASAALNADFTLQDDRGDASPLALVEASAPPARSARRTEVPRQHTELDIKSFVYRARRPFHPGRLWACLEETWPGVLRSKGLFWLATRMNES